MKQVEITPEVIEEHGLTSEEYEYILSIMGRTPTIVELGIFSVMWSEHASYKNSVKLLKTLPKDGPYMLAKAGDENAGVVDIGDGLAICFKIESHNHPLHWSLITALLQAWAAFCVTSSPWVPVLSLR